MDKLVEKVTKALPVIVALMFFTSIGVVIVVIIRCADGVC